MSIINQITAEKELLDCRFFSPDYAAIMLPHEKDDLKKLGELQKKKILIAKYSVAYILWSPLLIHFLSGLLLNPKLTYQGDQFAYFAMAPILVILTILLYVGILFALYLILTAYLQSDATHARNFSLRRGKYSLSIQKDVKRKKILILTNILKDAAAKGDAAAAAAIANDLDINESFQLEDTLAWTEEARQAEAARGALPPGYTNLQTDENASPEAIEGSATDTSFDTETYSDAEKAAHSEEQAAYLEFTDFFIQNDSTSN